MYGVLLTTCIFPPEALGLKQRPQFPLVVLFQLSYPNEVNRELPAQGMFEQINLTLEDSKWCSLASRATK